MSYIISLLRISGALHGLGSAGLAAGLLTFATCPTRGGEPSNPVEGVNHTDVYGDPLPPHVIARMGTVRFRQADGVGRIAFAPDGKTVLSAHDDIRAWDTTTGKELRRFTGHKLGVLAIALSTDGKILVSAGLNDQTVRFWDAATGKELAEKRKTLQDNVFSLGLSPDGKLLASGSVSIRLWDMPSGREVREFGAVDQQRVSSLAISPDGKVLAAAYEDGKVRLWDVATGKEVRQFPAGDNQWIGRIRFSPDGKTLATWGNDGKLQLWRAASGEHLRLLARGAADCYWAPFAFSPDGKTIVWSCPGDPVVRAFDVSSGKEVRQFKGHLADYMALTFSPDGKTLATGGADAIVRLWDVAGGKELHPVPGDPGAVGWVGLSPDGKTLASGGIGRSDILLWEAETGKVVRRLAGCQNQVCHVALSPDGKDLIAIGEDGSIGRWNLGSGKRLYCSRGKGEPPYLWSAALSPDGKGIVVVMGDRPGQIHLHDAATGKELAAFGQATCAAFSPDSKTVAGAWDQRGVGKGKSLVVGLWDAVDAKAVRSFNVPLPKNGTGMVRCIAFSPDGETVVTGGVESSVEDGELAHFRFFITTTGEDLPGPTSRDGRLHCLVFSPDGRILASGSADGTIRLWETSTRKLREVLRGHEGSVNSLCFSADGRRLASSSSDSTALLWDLSGRLPEGRRGPEKLTAKELEIAWDDLASDDAAKAYRAAQDLAASPKAAVKLLGERLRPIPADPKRLAKLLTDLDDNSFDVRDKARKELEELGEAAEAALQKEAAAPRSAETRRAAKDLLDRIKAQRRTPSGERLQALRAVEALEAAGTPGARDVLRQLAGGAAGVWLTREAEASLRRLSGTKAGKD
jgi:WD40 repeat protein